MTRRMTGPRESVEIRHLRYFLAVAEHGSFRKAGAALGIEQSAISRRIRDLEDRLGASLFHRQASGVTLTEAGTRYLCHVRRVMRSLGEGAQDIAAAGRAETGRVRLGVYSSIASGFLADLLQAYGNRHPDVRIELANGSPDELVTAVRGLNLDVAFLAGDRDWPDCERAALWRERLFVVLPERHRLASNAEARWQDLVGEPFIVSEAAPGPEVQNLLLHRLTNVGGHPDIQVQRISRENLLPLVALGRGLTLVSEAMTAATLPGITYRPISGETVPFSAVWSAKNDNPAFRRLLSMAKAASAKAAKLKP